MGAGDVEEFDVVVVGGGPGGSTLASLVAMQGHRVLVLEKEKFPRYQIGESLLPSTIHGVCRLTGVADEIAKAGFTLKRGGTFRWGRTRSRGRSRSRSPRRWQGNLLRLPGRADQVRPDPARPRPPHWAWTCASSTPSPTIIDDGDRVRGVSYTDADGKPRSHPRRYVVDASGNKSRIYQRVGATRQYSEFFRSLALFGYFEGGKRMPEPNSGQHLLRRLRQRLVLVHPAGPDADQRRRGRPPGDGQQDPGRPGAGARPPHRRVPDDQRAT